MNDDLGGLGDELGDGLGDVDDLETRWSTDALLRYVEQAEAAVEALQEHVKLVRAREGGQAEMPKYLVSSARLRESLDQFADAEFDWCGSFPIVVDIDDDLDDDLEDEDGDESGPTTASVAVEVRARYDVPDPDALIEAGRASYSRSWPQDTAEDVAQAVVDIPDAVAALVHEQGLAVLDPEATHGLLQGVGYDLAIESAVTPRPDEAPPN